MTRYFSWEKLLPECPKAEPKHTPKAITFPREILGHISQVRRLVKVQRWQASHSRQLFFDLSAGNVTR